MNSGHERISFLDSSRGLAAFVVFLAHFQLTKMDWFSSHSLYATPLRIIIDAEAAVLYFFILSGFVLTRSFVKSEKLSSRDYVKFAIKRILRIYPAFIAALLLTLLSLSFFGQPEYDWLANFWRILPEDFSEVLKQMILIKRIPNAPEFRILPHDWTLSIEMAVSLLLPVLAFATRINSIVALAAVYVSIKFLNLEPFTFDFTLGIFLAIEAKNLTLKTASQKLLCLFAGLFFITAGYYLPDFKNTDHILIHHKSTGLFFILILILSSTRIQRLLSIRPLTFLGKISYSFYLLHFVILLVFTKLFPYFNSITSLLILLPLTVLLSSISYYLVEKPFIQISHTLTHWRHF